jgi:DNA-directed RNA polymerase specialized sigma24 family protein
VEDWERDFAAYVEGRRVALRGTAYLLCGDWHSADDLTQTALTRLYLVWRRIDRIRSVDAYARQVLVRAYLDERVQPCDAAGYPLVFQARPTSEADRIEQARTCWITPDGAVLPTVLPTQPGQTCEPAIRWR